MILFGEYVVTHFESVTHSCGGSKKLCVYFVHRTRFGGNESAPFLFILGLKYDKTSEFYGCEGVCPYCSKSHI